MPGQYLIHSDMPDTECMGSLPDIDAHVSLGTSRRNADLARIGHVTLVTLMVVPHPRLLCSQRRGVNMRYLGVHAEIGCAGELACLMYYRACQARCSVMDDTVLWQRSTVSNAKSWPHTAPRSTSSLNRYCKDKTYCRRGIRRGIPRSGRTSSAGGSP